MSLFQEVKPLGGVTRVQIFPNGIFGVSCGIMLKVSQFEWGEDLAFGMRTSDNSMLVPIFQVGKLQFIELKGFAHGSAVHKWLYGLLGWV